MGNFRALGFLPLLAVATYWINAHSLLFVISFLLPVIVLFQSRPMPNLAVDDYAQTHDQLTGLYNRTYVLDRVGRYLQDESGQKRETAVLHVDIDQFRRINDRLGQNVGDKVLTAVGGRIKSCVRANDVVARIDGDDFAIALFPQNKTDVSIILSIAARLHKEMLLPLTIDGSNIYVSASIGVCLSGRAPKRAAQSILASAQIALDLAKREGPGATRSFSPKMRSEVLQLSTLSADLDAALTNGQIRPYFQPQINNHTGRITGFEALARWQHPQNGVILPAAFLKAIEAAGQAERLGEVILNHALTALKAWDRADLNIPTVGVNFSATELRNPKLVEKIKWEVDRFDLDPSRITIEVLEDVVSDHSEDVTARNIRAMAAHGFAIDLDDFGTGHASISNIQRFTVNRIKIDRSFVTRIDTDESQQKITAAIINMAEGLGIQTLAEGVETTGERSVLAQLGCRNIQGFGVARPMPFEDTIAWIAAYNSKLDPNRHFPRKTG